MQYICNLYLPIFLFIYSQKNLRHEIRFFSVQFKRRRPRSCWRYGKEFFLSNCNNQFLISVIWQFFYFFSLSVGDRVPADVRLVKVNELSADESSFTGEPCAQLKQVATVKGHGHEKLNISDMTNVAFQGRIIF